MSKSRDVAYGRRGGRWAAALDPARDEALEEWRRQRDALAAVVERTCDQLTIEDALAIEE